MQTSMQMRERRMTIAAIPSPFFPLAAAGIRTKPHRAQVSADGKLTRLQFVHFFCITESDGVEQKTCYYKKRSIGADFRDFGAPDLEINPPAFLRIKSTSCKKWPVKI